MRVATILASVSITLLACNPFENNPRGPKMDGYRYSIVSIGNQVWFAENLRTRLFANGGEIPAGVTAYDWVNATYGATAVYGEDSSSCFNASPDIDACDETQSLEAYGRLYNWYAVDDARGLCPSGWHVPTDQDWSELEDFLTSEGLSGTEGTTLKSTMGWNYMAGTDEFGFSAVPGGYRYYGNGNWQGAGNDGFFWTSSSDGPSHSMVRVLRHNDQEVFRYSARKIFGCSVRCLRDAE